MRSHHLGWASLIVLLAGVARASDLPMNQLSPQELADGWISLFDGTTLYGWKAATDADWQVVDGAIVATKATKPGLLHTTSQFGDYVLKVDFRIAEGGNSGVFLRTSPTPAQVNGRCYEVNIAPWGKSDWPTGSIVEKKRVEKDCSRPGWQSYELTAEGGRFVVKLDGQQVLEYTDPKPLGSGYIGLQFREGKVEFRNIKLKPLGLKSIFNGKDLTGWKTHAESKSTFSVTPEGTLHCVNGRGLLETEGQWANFVVQLEVFVNGKALNSGVFFRCVPGEFMNGYECQIQNGYKDDDRNKPQDCGTGGIFRRQDARKVMADDFQWFPMMITADGPHMAAWVNGVQVSDWTDTRKPDANPRKGLRLAAGTLQLQGHDATTDLSFRNLRAGELPPREEKKK